MQTSVQTTRLTGNIYYRQNLLGHLLLQVEEESLSKSGALTKGYRDADIEDAKALGILQCDYSKIVRRRLHLDAWLTGQARHRASLFSGRVLLHVEAIDGGYIQSSFFKCARAKDISPQLLKPTN